MRHLTPCVRLGTHRLTSWVVRCGGAALQRTVRLVGAVPDGTEAAGGATTYAPWEVRALVLALLPVERPGVAAIAAKEVMYLLPSAVREQIQAYKGGLMAYAQDHFAQDVQLDDAHATLLRKADLGSGFSPDVDATTVPPVLTMPPSSAAAPERTRLDPFHDFIDYVPTFFVRVEAVAAVLPEELRQRYAGTSLRIFLRRFRFHVEMRTRHGVTEVRLRRDLAHPHRGNADQLYTSTPHVVDAVPSSVVHNSEAGLMAMLVPRLPTTFTALSEVLREVSETVARHPAFDPRLGVAGLLERYPEYIQLVDGKLRLRPAHVAPNALDELDAASSPLPEIFAKVCAVVTAAAAGKDYAVAAEKTAAAVPTGRLYALLTSAERDTVRATCRSFPRFLRLHGKELVVSTDNMQVYHFRPAHEPCADALVRHSLRSCALAADDPVLQIPAEMDAGADWAVQELYNALPLTQCAELADVLSLVPTSVRQALPSGVPELRELLARHPDYILTWPFPDDPAVILIQRAKLPVPVFDKDEIVRLVLPYVPQGGTELDTLLHRVPLALQRYFYHHGLRKTLQEMDDVFRVSDKRVICIKS